MSESITLVGERLQAALETVMPGAVFPEVYVGDAVEYIVWNKNVQPALWADDAPGANVYSIQVHLYAPREKNVTETILAIDRALFAADFTWPSATDVSDAEGQHWELWCYACDGGGLYGYT